MIHRNPQADQSETSPELGTQVESLRADLRGLGRSFARALKLEWLNLKTEALDSGVKAAAWCGVFAFFLVLFISAGSFVATGVRDLLGDLVGGLALLGLILALGLALRFRLRSQALGKARKVATTREPTESDGED
jgi:hypothetical protein